MLLNKLGEEGQAKLSFGLGLIALGIIILLTAAAIWLLAPINVPEGFGSTQELEPIFVPALTATTTVEPVATDPSIPPTEEIPVLLPETPLDTGGLPSFSAVTDAPTSYDAAIAGQPVRLVIPKLNIDTAVRRIGLQSFFDGDSQYFQWAVPNGYEAGWHETSAPLGQPGNTVLNGHNNIYGEIFRDLVDLDFGDQLTLYDDTGQTYTYEIQQQELLPENGQPISVRIENAQWIEATEDERVTLVSCWPYETNAYRVVVIARPLAQSANR